MNVSDWLQVFLTQVRETSILEWLAVATAVAEVLLARSNNVLLYPSGIISTLIYTWLMLHSGLYAESALNIYYLAMSIYGWVHWVRRKDQSPLPISRAGRRDWMITAAIIGIGWALLFIILHRFTDSNVPAWDAWVSATAWAGMWLLAKRKLENWILLNISNIFAIPLLLYKRLPLTSCLTLFLFIVAIFGYLEWRKLYRSQTNKPG